MVRSVSIQHAAASARSYPTRQRTSVGVFAGIKAVETYDGKFDLTKESDDTLRALLGSEVFCKQARLCKLHVPSILVHCMGSFPF